MIKRSIFLFAALLTGASFNVNGQGASDEVFSPEDNAAMQQRWMRFQPAIMLNSLSGTSYSGQPLHASMDTLYIFPSHAIPVGPESFKDLQRIPFRDIDQVLLQKGGNSVTRSRKSVGYQIPKGDKFYTPPFQALRNASVYADSLVQPQDLKDAIPNSKVMRQAFPDKHFRLSLGFSIGGQRPRHDALEALKNSALPYPEGSHGNPKSNDFLDISWRFMDRIIVGGQLGARSYSSSVYAYQYSEVQDANYHYEIFFEDYRLYAEYAFFNVDRYFLRRLELLTGAGFLMGRPEWSIYYSFNYHESPDNWIFGEERHEQKGNLYGVQLRSAAHYYVFPGLSLWAGLEANLYKPWIIEAVELPTYNPDAPILLPEHTLGFSGVRIKFGVSIYL